MTPRWRSRKLEPWLILVTDGRLRGTLFAGSQPSLSPGQQPDLLLIYNDFKQQKEQLHFDLIRACALPFPIVFKQPGLFWMQSCLVDAGGFTCTVLPGGSCNYKKRPVWWSWGTSFCLMSNTVFRIDTSMSRKGNLKWIFPRNSMWESFKKNLKTVNHWFPTCGPWTSVGLWDSEK